MPNYSLITMLFSTPLIFPYHLPLMWYSGVRGKLIYEKNLKLKISCQTPFNYKKAWNIALSLLILDQNQKCWKSILDRLEWSTKQSHTTVPFIPLTAYFCESLYKSQVDYNWARVTVKVLSGYVGKYWSLISTKKSWHRLCKLHGI